MPNSTSHEIEPDSNGEPELSLGSKLCTSCGLCCSGSIHNSAVLDEDEVPAARELGLPVLEAERPLFALPCPKLRNDCCTIYGSRPRVCGRYKCQLLQDLEAGSVEIEQALGHVRSAKDLFARMIEAMPAGMDLRETRSLALSPPAAGDARSRRRDMLLKLRATAFHLYIDKFFRNSRDGKLFALTSLGEPIMEVDKS